MELDTQISEDEYLYFHVKNITAKGIYTVILISAIIAYDRRVQPEWNICDTSAAEVSVPEISALNLWCCARK